MNRKFLALSCAVLAPFATSSLHAHDVIRVLLLDGPQKAHKYEETTPVLQQVLESADLFEVEHSRSSKESCEGAAAAVIGFTILEFFSVIYLIVLKG